MTIESKIINGLERLSDVFKTLLLDKAKVYGISPIQIQVLLFVDSHAQELCNVTLLSREFNLTKATMSDAIKSLYTKGYVEKDYSSEDSRSYTLFLSQEGNELIKNIEGYADPIRHVLKSEEINNPESFYTSLTTLIAQLNQDGVIQVQRTCFACGFYAKNESSHFCNLMDQPLQGSDIRLDCAEFKAK